MEKWDILNADGSFIGKTVVRGRSFLRQGEYHLVVHIWIVSTDGKFLIQRRSDSKKLMPGEWAATGGAAISGETSFAAARRELLEELGIDSNEQTLKQIKRFKRRNAFVDIWCMVSDVDCNSLKLQRSEVSQVRWVSKDELYKMIKEGRFHNYGKDYFSVILRLADRFKLTGTESVK